MKKYLVSGIGIGTSGAGRLMSVLIPKCKAKGYHVITRRSSLYVNELAQNDNYITTAKEKCLRFLDKLGFILKCLSVSRSEILFLHPQTAGYWMLFYLALLNRVNYYVLDNSFFCICSYNVHPINHSECLDCVGKINPHSLCSPSPSSIPRRLNIIYLMILKTMSSRIRFLAQNSLQSALLKAHFGNHLDISIIGMDAEECLNLKYIEISDNGLSKPDCSYDVVYHAASNVAKGLFYVIELARLLPDKRFLIPDSYEHVEKLLGAPPPSNIDFRKMTWETGLAEAVATSRLVINPSLWSAPIEGALVKSAKCNINVATVVSQYGYEAEFKGIRYHLRLSRDTSKAAQALRAFFALGH